MKQQINAVYEMIDDLQAECERINQRLKGVLWGIQIYDLEFKRREESLRCKTRFGVPNVSFNNESSKVYMLHCRDSNFYKIGRSRNVIDRVKSMQTGCPFKIDVFSLGPLTKTAITDEKTWHNRLEKYQTVGEWFELKPKLAKWIAEQIKNNRHPCGHLLWIEDGVRNL